MKLLKSLSLVLLALVAEPALAHGLLMKLRGEATAVNGELYYTNGKRAAGEWIEMSDLTAPDAEPVVMQTGQDGTFRIHGTSGHEYLVKAMGEEGHTVEMKLTLAPEARASLVDDAPAGAEDQGSLPAAWLVIGGALLLSAGPALMLRRRASSAGTRPENAH